MKLYNQIAKRGCSKRNAAPFYYPEAPEINIEF